MFGKKWSISVAHSTPMKPAPTMRIDLTQVFAPQLRGECFCAVLEDFFQLFVCFPTFLVFRAFPSSTARGRPRAEGVL